MQIRFQKRTTHHISFEGSYTISKSTDDSSAGRNNWVGALGNGQPQQLDRLYLEHSIGANDTPQRLALAVIVDMPIGRHQWIGGDMNRVLDAIRWRLVDLHLDHGTIRSTHGDLYHHPADWRMAASVRKSSVTNSRPGSA